MASAKPKGRWPMGDPLSQQGPEPGGLDDAPFRLRRRHGVRGSGAFCVDVEGDRARPALTGRPRSQFRIMFSKDLGRTLDYVEGTSTARGWLTMASAGAELSHRSCWRARRGLRRRSCPLEASISGTASLG